MKVKKRSKRPSWIEARAPDGVVGAHADPVGDRPVLPHLLRQLLLDPERLVRRLQQKKQPIRGISSSHVPKSKP